MKESEFPKEWWSMTREELEVAVPYGSYTLGDAIDTRIATGKYFLILTGKGGVINYILEVQEFVKSMTTNVLSGIISSRIDKTIMENKHKIHEK